MTHPARKLYPMIMGRIQPENTGKVLRGDHAAILLGCLVMISLVALGEFAPASSPYLSMLRIPLSLVNILFVPGYLLQAFIFPYHSDLDGLERAGLSLGLSVALLSILALLIDRSPWGIGIWTITLGQSGVILLLATLGYIRGLSLSGSLAYVPTLATYLRSWWSNLQKIDRRMISLLIAVLLIASLIVGFNFYLSDSTRFMTEFYILGVEGLAEDYPRKVDAGETINMIAGINNLEGESATYSIMLKYSDQQLVSFDNLTLQKDSKWQGEIVFAMPQTGEDQPVDILLARENYPFPYRTLRIWLNVQPDR